MLIIFRTFGKSTGRRQPVDWILYFFQSCLKKSTESRLQNHDFWAILPVLFQTRLRKNKKYRIQFTKSQPYFNHILILKVEPMILWVQTTIITEQC